MTSEEWLLIKLAEECVEVAQACTKALTYGLGHENPYSEIGKTNRDCLVDELNDVIGTLKILHENGMIPSGPDDIKICERMLKVKGEMEYAKGLGVIDI